MRDIIIELDRSDDFSDEELPPSRRGRRGLPFIAALLVLITLSTMGAASTRPRSPIELVADISVGRDARLTVVGTDLIVTEPGLISSYDLRTGDQRWRLGAQFNSAATVWRKGELLIAIGDQGESIQTMALDTGTGAIRWRLDGYAQYVTDDLLATYQSSIVNMTESRGIAFHRVDGSLVWTLNGGTSPVALDIERRVAASLNRETGELIEYDIRTGKQMRRAILADAAGADHIWYEHAALFAIFQDGPGRRYDVKTLERGSDLPMPGERLGRFDCGKVWCEPEGSGLALYDKVSGRLVFSTDRWHFGVATRAGVLGLFSGPDEGLVAVGGLYNPDTREVTDLAGWMALNVRYSESLESADRPVYLKSGAIGVNHLAVVDSDGLRMLGVIPYSEIRACDAADGLLACKIGGELVRIWRLA